MDLTLFDSRDARYKTPYGAVEEGTNVHLRICLPRDINCSAAKVHLHDELENTDSISDMFWCGMEGEHAEWWETDIQLESASLYFFHFALTTERGPLFLSRTWNSKGELTQSPIPWQITVYEKDFTTPDWLDGGIMYQIFPDSFCRSGQRYSGVPGDRRMNTWGAPPHWRPDEDGVFRNNRFFGGDLEGITSKLDYLQSLGVTCLYLNPIFESAENHRYSTADYTNIDPLLGTTEDFNRLCTEAEKRGMRVILDGVFSHTGSDSVYFNREGRYPNEGAYNTQDSPYISWYDFQNWPNQYSSWWGFDTLPELRENDPAVLEFLTGGGGIVQRWLGEGASGWRLDVADELPDQFLDSLRAAARRQKPDALIIGEVWEDASNKVAYSQRRRYLLGKQLDSVMNYCFRGAIIDFLNGMDAARAMENILVILENYPPQVTRLLMNMVGTHDTERIITALAGEPSCGRGRDWQCDRRLTPQQREYGRQRCRLAAVMQYTLPGVPSVYYGDEIGMEGYRDPFNRACFPWGEEDTEMLSWYRALGQIRRSTLDCFKGSDLEVVYAQGRMMAYVRRGNLDNCLTVINAGDFDQTLVLPEKFRIAFPLLGEHSGGDCLYVPAGSAVMLAYENH